MGGEQRILGIDLALNHSGFVLINEQGEMIDFHYITTRKGAYNVAPDISTYYKPPNSKDTDVKGLVRLNFMAEFICGELWDKMRPTIASLEGYAFDTHGAHQMGELNGYVRLHTYRSKTKLRIHDPLSVKMYSAHKGNAKKHEVVQAVRDRWGVDFSRYNGSKADATVEEDLSDAMALAQMGLTEYKLRNGLSLMSDYAPKEIQVFNRVTKRAPLNILAREWI